MNSVAKQSGDEFNQEVLKKLLNTRARWCVSLYIPTSLEDANVDQSRIRLKNLLGIAGKSLLAKGMMSSDVERLLGGATKMLSARLFWKEQTEGLAIFISPKTFSYYQLPVHFDEKVVVSNRYYLKPLLRVFQNRDIFYVLALSQNFVKLYEGTHTHFQEIEHVGIPENLSSHVDFKERQLQQHNITSTNGGPTAVYHGHTNEKSNGHMLLNFLRQVKESVEPVIHNTKAPLILAGVEPTLALYRNICAYPDLAEESIPGNPEHIVESSLMQRAKQIANSYINQTLTAALESYFSLSNTDYSSKDLDQIVSAAYIGQVKTLFIAANHEQWGHFDAEENQIVLGEEVQDIGEDLLDFAAVHTIMNSGEVFILEKEDMPFQKDAVAIFRYPYLAYSQSVKEERRV